MAADIYREQRKQELRQRIIDTEKLGQEPEAKDKRRKKIRKRIRIVIALVIVLALIIFAHFLSHREFHSFSVRWKVDFTEGNAVEPAYEEYVMYLDGLIKVTRDGANYLNSAGDTIWNQSYEMNHPYVDVNGDYAVIADQGNNQIYILGKNGTTGQALTLLPITKAAVSRQGVVYVILDDGKASYITVFSKEGEALDISIKSVLSGDGYPLDISVSPDGTELIASFVYLENGMLRNKVVFYNLSEIGQTSGQNRVVAGFTEDFQGVLSGRVHFSDNTYAQAFYNGGVAFFSTEILTTPELIENVKLEETIHSIAYTEDYVGLVVDNRSAENGKPFRVLIYKTNGQNVLDQEFDFQYDGFVIDNKQLIFYKDNMLSVYDLDGKLRYTGNLDVPISFARKSSQIGTPFSMSILLGSTGMMESVKLS